MVHLVIQCRAKLPLFAAVFAVLLATPIPAGAISGKDNVATRGTPVNALPGWPKGVMKLINHRLRTAGWHSWFSECPNDVYDYGMDVRGMDDLNAMLKLLAAVKAKHVVLNFDPAAGGPRVGGVGAVFTIGNQPILDRWFKQLPFAAPGVRRFGLRLYREPPTAQPPTLTVYTGSKWFDWTKLKVPLRVEVSTGAAASYRKQYEEAFEMIDAFIEGHNAKRRATKTKKSR